MHMHRSHLTAAFPRSSAVLKQLVHLPAFLHPGAAPVHGIIAPGDFAGDHPPHMLGR